MVKKAVNEYMDYATVHGVSRMKNSPFLILKVLWVLALCGSLGMIIWQVSVLYRKYKSYPISTSVEVMTDEKIKFPHITICNTNPVQYSKIATVLDQVISNAAKKYSIDIQMFNHTRDPWQYNGTDGSQGQNSAIENDILWYTSEEFKVAMATYTTQALIGMSQPQQEFMLLCNFAGVECGPQAWSRISRTYDYGLCYTFNPKMQEPLAPHGEMAGAGPRYALEVLLNVDVSESIPFVTSSGGVVIATGSGKDVYFDKDNSVFLPTGFEANIGLTKVRYKRVPGKDLTKLRCHDNEEYETLSILENTLLRATCNVELILLFLEDCRRNCLQEAIDFRCGCYQYFFDKSEGNDEDRFNQTTDYRPCTTREDIKCIYDSYSTFTVVTPEECLPCISTCDETTYKHNVAMVSWPSTTFVPILRRILDAKLPQYDSSSFDRNLVRDNLLLVRIYMESLTYENIEETYSYEVGNFISDIGGQLGLWAGFSVLSVLELVELFLLLFAVRAKEDNSVKAISPMPEDFKQKQSFANSK